VKFEASGLRMSVTDLDSYRYYKQSEEMTTEELIQRLRKEEEPDQRMLAGRALHTLLEHIGEGDHLAAEAEGFTFRFIAECEVPALPVRELKGELEIATAYGKVTLVGKIDGTDGAVHDYKLTKRFDAESYADSYQWRCYLLMFGAQRFVYDVFEGKESDDSPSEWLIVGFHRFPLYAYQGMEADVRREVSEFAGFLVQHREALERQASALEDALRASLTTAPAAEPA
jgi:hypothetical protein